jgi:asparagine synthase (glutamine-hydrolysing)
VRERLRAEVPVCFQLSGGVDSSAVAALGARNSPGPIQCFTVGFDDDSQRPAEGYDEQSLAEQTARQLGAELHPVRLGARALVDALPDAVFHGEGVAINGHLPAKFLLSAAMARAGFRVVLTGEGADEVLAGYAHLRRDLALAGDAGDRADRGDAGDPSEASALAGLSARNAASAGIMLPAGASLPMDAARAALGFVPSWLAAKGTLGYRVRTLLARDFLRAFEGRDAARALMDATDVAGQLRGRHPVEQSLYLWTRAALSGYILRTLGDGMEMAHGIEGRLPFLDGPVFDLARTLPLAVTLPFGLEKRVLREALRGRIPEAVRTREKHPFLAPPLWRAPCGALAELVQETLRSTRAAALPCFDRAAVLAVLDRLEGMDPGERALWDPALMLTVSIALLAERFGL